MILDIYFLLLLISAAENIDLSAMESLTLHNVTDIFTGENKKYSNVLKSCEDVFNEVETLFNSEDFENKNGWFRDEENDEGDVVYAKDTQKGRMVTISTELPLSTEEVMKETWNGINALPQWNKNINFASVIAKPTPNIDIVTYGNNDVLVVSGREFISARIWRKVGNDYILAARSVEIDGFKSENKDKVRAFLHLAGARFRPHPKNPDVTLTDVAMLVDLKGMLPKFLVNRVIGKIMLMDTVLNRKHFQDIKAKRANNSEN